MSDRDFTQAGFELARKDLGLEALGQKEYSREELIQYLAEKVAYMMEYELEQLFSLLYRMDVQQISVEKALNPEEITPSNIAIAELILNRQVQRAKTKAEYKQNTIDDLDEELKF